MGQSELASTANSAKVDPTIVDPTWLAMKNAHQLGIICRVTRKIVRCKTLQDIGKVIEDAANEFSISGCFRALSAGEQISLQFGAGLNRGNCHGLSCFFDCDKKLNISEQFMVFKTNQLVLVLLRADLNARDADILQDNLTILIDTLHYWLESHERITLKEREANSAKLVVAQQMSDILQTMLRFGEHLIQRHQSLCQNLLSSLLAKLPSLGLEIDQEESMITMIGNANTAHGQLLDLQITHNEDMRTVMGNAVELLVHAEIEHGYDATDKVPTDDTESILF